MGRATEKRVPPMGAGGRRRRLIVEFRTADGDALAISVPDGETRALKYFQERMPYGLFVPEIQ
jgi:hypothetical protein